MPKTSDRLTFFTESVIREMTRVANQYEAINLSQGFPDADPVLEDALSAAFPKQDIRRVAPSGGADGLSYQVRFPLPLTFLEARLMVRRIREGLAQLLARFEPQRYRALREVLDTLGVRETLSSLYLKEPPTAPQPLSTPPLLGGTVVH